MYAVYDADAGMFNVHGAAAAVIYNVYGAAAVMYTVYGASAFGMYYVYGAAAAVIYNVGWGSIHSTNLFCLPKTKYLPN